MGDAWAIEPVFDAPGSPTCSAIRASLSSNGHAVSCDLEPEYFRPAAERLALGLVADGKLSENDRFLFQISAFRQANAPRASRAEPGAMAGGFRVEERWYDAQGRFSLSLLTPRG